MIIKISMYYSRLLLQLCCAVLTAKLAIAAESDHRHCTAAINFYEDRYKLPKNLLHSIAVVESGRWNEKNQNVLPWPWTLNAAGKSYYFDSKDKAVSFFKELVAKGVEQIDVGCAQVNWHYHGKKHFKTPEHALNPILNVAYAAFFLSQNYNEVKDWEKAVAIYHSRVEDRGKNYASKVHKVWKKNNKKKPYLKIEQREHKSVLTHRPFFKIFVDKNLTIKNSATLLNR